MGFKCGLVGMPNVGKSSIFNLLTKQSIPANNYPFCTIDPNNAFVEVPDERLSKLSKINNSKKTVNAAIEFVDIAGLIKGASKGEGLGNEFLSHINSVDVIAHVVRFFEDKEILVQNSKNADSYKEVSEKSFQEYTSLVQEYRNFHEKLVGNVKYQGEYNEKKLQRLLEKNGLVKDQDFTVREGQVNKDPITGLSKRVNPDFIITLPEENSIVIDCKVSLKNFEDFANEKDPKLRSAHINKHLASVRDHIKNLAKKNYTKLYNLKSFQYVIMFMPFDTCYLSAIEYDKELLDFAAENKIILAGPISIMALIANVTSLKNQHKHKLLKKLTQNLRLNKQLTLNPKETI